MASADAGGGGAARGSGMPLHAAEIAVIALGAVAAVLLAASVVLAIRLQRERRRLEEARAALERRTAQQRALTALAAAVSANDELDVVLQAAIEAVAAGLGVERGAILERSADGRRLEARVGTGWPAGALARLSLPADGPLGSVALSGGPWVAERLDAHPALHEAALRTGQGGLAGLIVPVRGGTDPWGILAAFGAAGRCFADDEVQFAEAAALLVGGAVTRAEGRRIFADQQARLRAVWEHTADGLVMLDETGAIEAVNPAMEQMFARSQGELVGTAFGLLLLEPHRGDFNARLAARAAGGVTPLAERPWEALGQRVGGTVFPLDLSLEEIVLEGRRRYIGTIRDLTDRRATEEQLRQAQRMEAVGELTGGLAHDFNNLLTVVLGNAELLAEGLADHPRLRQLAETSRDAAQRGAELTRRLLAFSRRQTLQPLVLDLNKLVLEVEKLLRRTLGEHIDIETVLHAGLWKVHVDPGQLEAALINLALNARDAMPEGGKLTIETANARLDDSYAAAHAEVTPGQYVVTTVTDTGTGMPAEVRDRAFEPFFTTKDVGKGTGLGLSMVYGFVKQSGGHVKIYSEMGQGTAVKIYLPRAQLSHPEPGPAPAPASERTPTGSEHILVVEDDPLVRGYVTEQLRALGYAVDEAPDGPMALRLLPSLGHVDLLLTDVVMPGGMNGRQLAERAQALQPGLRVLYTSGYTENAIIHHGRLDPGVHLLTKPFRKVELARKVRAVLDEPRGPAG